MMALCKCLKVVDPGPLCDRCAEAEREYVAAVFGGLEGGVHIDNGTVRNAGRAQRLIQRYDRNRQRTVSEWQREARNRVCPRCHGGLKVIDNVDGYGVSTWALACNNGHEFERPQDCPHYLEMERLEAEAAETIGGPSEQAPPVEDDITALFGQGG